ncbi:uncharacterized protein PRCAT00005051001 [Priceomyces carsonii]|uniref:uncharacterized protein n=1 Tax=Priceomyces carsonii TaxID=28549 RepID=UPI002EDB2EAC|nr:unnamed protein product [Priceomyces carsonii]
MRTSIHLYFLLTHEMHDRLPSSQIRLLYSILNKIFHYHNLSRHQLHVGILIYGSLALIKEVVIPYTSRFVVLDSGSAGIIGVRCQVPLCAACNIILISGESPKPIAIISLTSVSTGSPLMSV